MAASSNASRSVFGVYHYAGRRSFPQSVHSSQVKHGGPHTSASLPRCYGKRYVPLSLMEFATGSFPLGNSSVMSTVR